MPFPVLPVAINAIGSILGGSRGSRQSQVLRPWTDDERAILGRLNPAILESLQSYGDLPDVDALNRELYASMSAGIDDTYDEAYNEQTGLAQILAGRAGTGASSILKSDVNKIGYDINRGRSTAKTQARGQSRLAAEDLAVSASNRASQQLQTLISSLSSMWGNRGMGSSMVQHGDLLGSIGNTGADVGGFMAKYDLLRQMGLLGSGQAA